jgi:hypothetical protein
MTIKLHRNAMSLPSYPSEKSCLRICGATNIIQKVLIVGKKFYCIL